MGARDGIKNNRILAAMNNKDFARLSPFMVDRRVERDTPICEPRARVDIVYFPKGAVFSIVTPMANGQGAESGTVGFESATGLLNALGDSFAFSRTVVQLPGNCVTLPAAQLRAAAAASPALTTLLIVHAQIANMLAEQSVACNALHAIESRLCRWLLLSADSSGTDVLPLTQEFLSFMLGVQRTTVTLAARTLAASGVIRYRRGMLELVDRPRIEEIACECYRAVKHEQARLLANYAPVR